MPVSAADALCRFVPPFMRYLREGLAKVNISPARFQILQALTQGEARSMVELSERLSVTKRNITSLVDGLEKEGLVARRPHPTDRRSTLVAMTPAGEEVFARAAQTQQEHLKALLTGLDPAEQRQMSRALGQLVETMTAKDRP
ncbi:MAG: MarR family transcriptional regulator [Pseudomonadota bacterium]